MPSGSRPREVLRPARRTPPGIFATGAALDYLVNTVGYENIQAREQALVHYLMGELMQLDFVQIIGSIYWDNHHGVVSFNVKGIHPHDVASIMDMDGRLHPAPVTTARSRCSPGWASRTLPAAAPA